MQHPTHNLKIRSFFECVFHVTQHSEFWTHNLTLTLTVHPVLNERGSTLSRSSLASFWCNLQTQYQNLVICNNSMAYNVHTSHQVHVSTRFSELKVIASGLLTDVASYMSFSHFQFVKTQKLQVFIYLYWMSEKLTGSIEPSNSLYDYQIIQN